HRAGEDLEDRHDVLLAVLLRHRALPVDVERVRGEDHAALGVLVRVGTGLAVAEVHAGLGATRARPAVEQLRRVLPGEEHDREHEDEAAAAEAATDRHAASSSAGGRADAPRAPADPLVERHAQERSRGPGPALGESPAHGRLVRTARAIGVAPWVTSRTRLRMRGSWRSSARVAATSSRGISSWGCAALREILPVPGRSTSRDGRRISQFSVLMLTVTSTSFFTAK